MTKFDMQHDAERDWLEAVFRRDQAEIDLRAAEREANEAFGRYVKVVGEGMDFS